MKITALLVSSLLISSAVFGSVAAAQGYSYRGSAAYSQGYHRPYLGYPYFPLSSGVVFPVPNSYSERRPKVLGQPLSDPRRARGRGNGCRYIVAEAYNSKGVSRSLCPRR